MSTSQSPVPPEGHETRELLRFLREENTASRSALRDDAEASRKLLLDTVKIISIPVSLLIAIAAILGFRSVTDLKKAIQDEARDETKAEISRMQKDIHSRLAEQFQTPELKKIVKEAAAESTKAAAEPLIKREVAKQVSLSVEAERPEIRTAVTHETQVAVKQMSPQIDSQIKDSVNARVRSQVQPIEQIMEGLNKEANVQHLITMMNSDDATAYDHLRFLLKETVDPQVKEMIHTALINTTQEHQSVVRLGYRGFDSNMPVEDKLNKLSDPDPLMREAALAFLEKEPKLVATRVFELATSDTSLNVRCKAGIVFDTLTKQGFSCLDLESTRTVWWETHKQEFAADK